MNGTCHGQQIIKIIETTHSLLSINEIFTCENRSLEKTTKRRPNLRQKKANIRKNKKLAKHNFLRHKPMVTLKEKKNKNKAKLLAYSNSVKIISHLEPKHLQKRLIQITDTTAFIKNISKKMLLMKNKIMNLQKMMYYSKKHIKKPLKHKKKIK